MHMTVRMNRPSSIFTRGVSLVFLAACASLGLYAQQPQAAAVPVKPVDLLAELKAPLELSAPAELSYSSSVGASETDSAENFNLSGREDQPPPRRTYSRRPNYNDKTHNSDGSNKYGFVVGGGFTLPVGGTHNYYGTSWDFQGGFGRFFNKNFGVMIDFNWANFGIQTHTLNTLLAIYNSPAVGGNLNQLGGYAHVWSFALDPVYNVLQGDASGLYVTGGVGFYHKISTFTIPALGSYCDPFYGCFTYQANQPIDSYTSNAVGFNGGFGYTYKFSKFGNERLFAEARYVYTHNSKRPYYDGTNGTPVSGNPTYFNVFPQNSAPTTYIPVTFGIRF